MSAELNPATLIRRLGLLLYRTPCRRLLLQEKSLSLGDRTISNLGDPAPTPSHRLNSSKLARTTKPTPSSSKSLDLSACYSKQFEEGDKGVPGIHFTFPTGTSCWSPVMQERSNSIYRFHTLQHCRQLIGRPDEQSEGCFIL